MGTQTLRVSPKPTNSRSRMLAACGRAAWVSMPFGLSPEEPAPTPSEYEVDTHTHIYIYNIYIYIYIYAYAYLYKLHKPLRIGDSIFKGATAVLRLSLG